MNNNAIESRTSKSTCMCCSNRGKKCARRNVGESVDKNSGIRVSDLPTR